MKKLDLRNVLKVINFKSYQNDFILILEDFGETTVDRYFTEGTSESFELGKKSLSDCLIIVEKLYGREVAIQIILNAVDRLMSTVVDRSNRFHSELLLLSGFFGVGKIEIINEVCKLLCRRKVYFFRGEFSAETKVQFSAFIQVIGSLIGQLLSEDDERLNRYRDCLLEIIGDRGQVFIDRIPSLEQIIGTQSPVEELSVQEGENLFKRSFQKFTALFAVLEQPLVIFLDNVQWIDDDSLELLKIFLQTDNLLVICADRDRELSGIHPMMMTVNQLKQQGVIVNNILLSFLSTEQINELVADSFNSSIDAVRPLAELIDCKTNGNPFFVMRFLKSLKSDGLVKFNAQFDVATIGAVSPERLLPIADPVFEARIAPILAEKYLLGAFLFYSHCAMLSFLASELTCADAYVQQAREYLDAVNGSIYEVAFYFYDSLIALAQEDSALNDLVMYPARVRPNQQQLAHWAEYAPMNHLHKWQLVEAEIARRAGDKAIAIDFYDRAIAGAKEGDYIQESALANELAAKFYLAWDKAKIARDYFQAAYDDYHHWGATAKIAELTDRYPQMFAQSEEFQGGVSLTAHHQSLLSQSLLTGDNAVATRLDSIIADYPDATPSYSTIDLNTHIRAIQGLSSEIDLDRLLRILMDIVVENAGADRAALLLHQDGQLKIAIEYDHGDLDTLDFDLHSFDREYRLPLFLIRNIHRTLVAEIYQDGTNPYLAIDPYFEEHRPQSISCVPILNQSRLIGILYLENTLTSGAFSHDRVELLNIICTQAAISLENARLHQESQAYAQKLEQSLIDLQFSEARLSKVADNIPGAIAQVCIDPQQETAILRYISSGCYELYEVTAPEMIEGKYTLRHFEHPEDRSSVDLAIQAARQRNIPIKIENRIVTLSGKQKWIQLAASSLEPQLDGTLITECTILDITDRKQAEIQLKITNEELLRSNRLKDQFLANMSHELRTPLNAILGMTEGLQKQVFGAINAEQLVALDTVEHSSKHLLALINDILELAKIEAGQLELHCFPTEIEPLCQSSLIFIKELASQKQIQVDVKIPPNLPNLLVDKQRIRQVLINLLNNAVKFTPAGGHISLEVAYVDVLDSTTIDLNFASRPIHEGSTQPRIAISIADTGIGISPYNMNKLFQPFIQIDGALNRQFEGTGLGLSLVKRIIDLHHGEVDVSSELGLGSCFTIYLPCTSIQHSAPKHVDVDLLSPQSETTESFTTFTQTMPARLPLILLVEDNDANINTMSNYLNAKGYEIVLARNGCEAIEQTKAIAPDVILMDIQMPVMDGLTATRQIREFCNIPIIAITALATNEDRQSCMEAGANDYFSKPVKFNQLNSVIDRCIDRKSLLNDTIIG